MRKNTAIFFCACAIANIIGCASELHTGHLIVSLTDEESGLPITNATVSVRSQIMSCLVEAPERFFSTTSAQTDTNGIAHVEFQFKIPDFDWWVTSPSYHTRGYIICNEHFYPIIVKSDYLNIDTNTVDGLSKFNEIKALYESDNPDDYNAFVKKFNPKSVTYTNDVIHRSASFYPKHNPQPMYAYTSDDLDYDIMPEHAESICSNGIEYVRYDDVDFDLEQGAFLPPYGGRNDCRAGKVSDFKIVRYCVTTNGVKDTFGWIEFARGCGAYRQKKTGNESFPSTYVADTNATYLSKIHYRYYRSEGESATVDVEELLPEDEYMVLRTRALFDDDTCSITNCHYSKILGEMYFGKRINFKASVFNQEPNNPNLEYKVTSNPIDISSGCPWP